jgi:hypothetical protein
VSRMRFRGPSVVVVGVVLLVVAVAAGFGSASRTKSGARRGGEGRTLRWVNRANRDPPGVHGNFVGLFHSREEFVPGDGFTVWNDVPGGGHEEMYCVIATQDPRRTFWCRRVFVLPRGQIVAAGEYDNASDGNNPGTIPVVGGTGAYLGARGTMTSTGDGRRGITITIHLR